MSFPRTADVAVRLDSRMGATRRCVFRRKNSDETATFKLRIEALLIRLVKAAVLLLATQRCVFDEMWLWGQHYAQRYGAFQDKNV